jgi:hypothetical protein
VSHASITQPQLQSIRDQDICHADD